MHLYKVTNRIAASLCWVTKNLSIHSCGFQGFKLNTLEHMDVSENGGTPKWMVYHGKPYWNGIIWGYHYFWKLTYPRIEFAKNHFDPQSSPYLWGWYAIRSFPFLWCPRSYHIWWGDKPWKSRGMWTKSTACHEKLPSQTPCILKGKFPPKTPKLDHRWALWFHSSHME